MEFPKNFYNIFNDFVAIGNKRITSKDVVKFVSSSMVKILRKTVHVVNKQLPNTKLMIYGDQTSYDIEKYCTNLGTIFLSTRRRLAV